MKRLIGPAVLALRLGTFVLAAPAAVAMAIMGSRFPERSKP